MAPVTRVDSNHDLPRPPIAICGARLGLLQLRSRIRVMGLGVCLELSRNLHYLELLAKALFVALGAKPCLRARKLRHSQSTALLANT
jgi:hypothetical protein